jgi:hypothetical protein
MTLPTSDDGRREGPGVVVSLLETSEGRLCLVLDDAQHQPGVDASVWRPNCFFTAREYSKAELVEAELSTEQFALIGENIVMRLVALRAARGLSGYRDA